MLFRSDTVAPVAVCQNITVFLDGAGNASIASSDLDGDRKSVVSGKSVDLGGGRIIKKTKDNT